MRKLELVVVVKWNATGKAKCPWNTDITILGDGQVVATATLGGKYNQRQALATFQRNPKQFNFRPALPQKAAS